MNKLNSGNHAGSAVKYAFQRYHTLQTSQNYEKAHEIESAHRPILYWASAGQGIEDINLSRLDNPDTHPLNFSDVYDDSDDYHASVEVRGRFIPSLMVSAERSRSLTTEEQAIYDFQTAMTRRQYGLAQVIYNLHESVRMYADTFREAHVETVPTRRIRKRNDQYGRLDARLAEIEIKERFARAQEVNLARK